MTPRAVVLGLVSAALVCAFCYFNDFVMRQTFLVGNYMPISVYGGLLVFVLVVNPVLLKMSRRLALTGRELAVIVALTLVACYVPGRGLMHYFTTFLMMPHHYERTSPGWKEHQVVEMAPRVMLAGVPARYRAEDILEPLALTRRLVDAADQAGHGPARLVWDRLGEEGRAAVRDALAAAQEDRERHARIAAALDAALGDPAFYRAEDFAEIDLPTRAKELAQRPREDLSPEEVRRLNREALQAAYPKTVAAHRPGDYAVRPRDVVRWPAFCERLLRQARRGGPGPGARLWERLPEDARRAAGQVVDAARQAERRLAFVVDALNELVADPDLYRHLAFWDVKRTPQAEALLARTWDEGVAARLLGHTWRALAPRRGPSQRLGHLVAMNRLLERAERALSPEEARRLNRHLLDAAFPQGLRSLGATEDYALNGFLQGLGVGREHIALSQIPWHAWWRTLGFWVPLLLTFSIAVIGLAVVVHRQWSDHEHLPYPIVTFAHALLPAEGEARGGVFRNRLFWLGALIVLAIHLNNYAYEWWPRYLLQVPRQFDFMALRDVLPSLHNPGHLLNPTISFTATGFAYFLATDVSLSVGLAPFVYEWAAAQFAAYGVSFVGGGFLSLQVRTFLHGGAYLGMFLVLLYTGRHYYLGVLRRSVFLPAAERPPGRAVWAARVFLVGAGLFAAQLVWVGLPVYLAAVYTVGAVLIFTVVSRVVAETGIFFIHAYHFPCVLLWGFLGARAIGPQAMLVMFMVTSLLLIDPRESVMPFMVQGLKLVEANRARVGRTAVACVAALVVAFAVAVPATLFWQYDKGVNSVADGWTRGVPRMAFDSTVRAMERLKAQGLLEAAGTHGGLGWLRSLSPDTSCVVAFGATFALVLLFGTARLRFPRWPFHPVMFLVLGTFQSRTLAVSFLLGWFVKLMVTKYGGAKVYQRLKPMMIGLIAGDMLGGLVPMIIGAVYWWLTDEPPRRFQVLPL